MKVVVLNSAVESAIGAEEFSKINQLILYAIDGRHVVIFESSEAEMLCLNQFSESCRESYRKFLDSSKRKAVLFPGDAATVRIVFDGAECWNDPEAVLKLDSAISLLQEPLGIFVENSENDWFFLKGIVRRADREKLEKAVEKGWVVCLHGGGSNINQQLLSRKNIPCRCLRTFVLSDSDRCHPDELKDGWAPVKPESCQGYDLELILKEYYKNRYWVLKRRFIESYIPKVELEKSGFFLNNVICAYFSMGNNERWFYNFKKGFGGDSQSENRNRSRDLYSHLPTDIKELLKDGFGRAAANVYKETKDHEFDWDLDALEEAAVCTKNLLRLI